MNFNFLSNLSQEWYINLVLMYQNIVSNQFVVLGISSTFQ